MISLNAYFLQSSALALPSPPPLAGEGAGPVRGCFHPTRVGPPGPRKAPPDGRLRPVPNSQ
jgi:hypothetical protein